MDPRWQPYLEHPPGLDHPTPEARGLFAAGWHAAVEECRIVNLADQAQQLVSPQTWRALRQLSVSVPVQLSFAERAVVELIPIPENTFRKL